MGNNGYRCPEDKLLKGEGTITRFNFFVGKGAAIGGSGCIDGDHDEVLVNYANLFFGHVRPRQVDGFDTYEGVRVKYVALPANQALGFSLAKAIMVEPIENGGSNGDDHRGNRVSRRKERPSKIGDPRYAGGTD
ncbi:hypothetical protein A2W54_03180 [Candidatus Giovannonibacteria bacterium RIFCSPHIGHO2_02_43_13]|uniref:Uncharacterized protein n=1 Tax=Candidatus Giovannonibacteria bacterium RIFCSPHIGHO2_02_43_13 TaxID=1798330 RepID=A0A1F5WQ21_9BACT|nr:MAG: hypothetical protein UW28_C0014G0004 [Parcubacteria group bacterium GW2011_GWA2_44_13]OGF73028.1 MAG: hypothetical protein A3E06_00380 [Candidatus Giovannonibacteria bacterium RIFCSPHIGHO2_12_FULL_44_42]OGF77749.1 MAG: hypothetical protein A2W54_03180 [Candidatus Giovannonibacteria bacterium RIFCSPHIGHO2_02_43_13]OGF88951.1 MAG: hypothetical protein A3I94_02825 [Candidatus Giovannonibacteria bacterium RIFCSPLOWO2_02_FULL_43_54]OGF97124.1 MAG: hypothetical protein A3H08_03540 [Candidatus